MAFVTLYRVAILYVFIGSSISNKQIINKQVTHLTELLNDDIHQSRICATKRTELI